MHKQDIYVLLLLMILASFYGCILSTHYLNVVICHPLSCQTFAGRLYGPFAFLIPVAVALSTFGGVNGILLASSRYDQNNVCLFFKIFTLIQDSPSRFVQNTVCLVMILLRDPAQKKLYRPNLIFWIVMGYGKARFGRKGQKTT